MVHLQTNLPPNRASMCPYPWNRCCPSSRMSRSRHSKIHYRLDGEHQQPNTRNHSTGESNPRLCAIQGLHSPHFTMPFLQTCIYFRRPNPFHWKRHPRRHHLPFPRLPKSISNHHCRRSTRTRYSFSYFHLLFWLAHLRRLLLRESHPPNVRLRPPLPRPCRPGEWLSRDNEA